MIILGFIVAILVYVIACIIGVRAYFSLMSKSKIKLKNSLTQIISSYILFGVFVITVIPFAIFFPAWLSEKLMIIERTSTSTIILILFGCFVLALSIWKGRNYRKDINNF